MSGTPIFRLLCLIIMTASIAAAGRSTNKPYRMDSLSYADKPALRSADWVKDGVIYCVYLRSFSKEGTFAALEARIPELKALGVTIIWLMPIHPVGLKNRKGTLGSPYSVRDYYDTNPEFGTMVDFQSLLNTVHQNGMKLVIDLVADHTSWDSKLIKAHPEWYKKDAAGKIISPNNDWTDVAALDYSKPGLRTYMIDMMEWWVRETGIDGFRCDVAEMVPTDFWEEARVRLDAVKDVLMLSEGSAPEHHLKAFDITYSWDVYDALLPLLKGKRPASYIDEMIRKDSLLYPSGSIRLRFNTNHDKNAWDAPAVVKFGEEGLKLSAVLVNTIAGIPLLYNGEEVPNAKKLSLFEKVEIDWDKPIADIKNLYSTLFSLRKNHKAISRGKLLRVPTTDDADIYAFFRTNANDRVLVALNFSDTALKAALEIPLEKIFPGKSQIKMTDVFTGKVITIDRGKVADLEMEPKGYRVFEMK